MFHDITDEVGLRELLAREFPSMEHLLSEERFVERFLTEFYPHDDEAREKCTMDDQHVEQILSDWSKDIWYDAGTWIMADHMASLGAPVFLYQFTEKVQFEASPAIDARPDTPRSENGAFSEPSQPGEENVKGQEDELGEAAHQMQEPSPGGSVPLLLREPKSSHGGDLYHWNGMKPLFFAPGVNETTLPSHLQYESETSEKYAIISHADPGATTLGRTMMNFLGRFAWSGDPNVKNVFGKNTAAFGTINRCVNSNVSADSAEGQDAKNFSSHAVQEHPESEPLWERHSQGSGMYMELGPGLGMREISKQARKRHLWFEDTYFKRRVIAEIQKSTASSVENQEPSA